MTVQEAHALATANPVRTLTARLGELKEQADREIANLASTLKHIDDTTDLLKEHGVYMTLNLLEIGNAAQNARRAASTDADTHAFSFPRGEAAA